MQLSQARPPYVIPSYSLTGDLLAYLNCGLQYRYQNRGSLPPSTPVQLWFGEFIHAVMEEAYLRWQATPALRSLPWAWDPVIRDIELAIFRRLRARGLAAPPNLFCPSGGTPTGPRCTCPEPSHQRHQLLASRRAEATINAWAAQLFPLISEAEVNVRGIRAMPVARRRRANYYEVSGTIDVLGAVQISSSPPGNLILHHLHTIPAVAEAIGGVTGRDFEIILDYKGMRRPSLDSPAWEQFAWQVQTYAWLRNQQKDAAPVVAAILLFVNELAPSAEDLRQLRRDLRSHATDVKPGARDDALLTKWRPRTPPPQLSTTYRERRSMRIVPVDSPSISRSLNEFDNVVGDIEGSVLLEMQGESVIGAWRHRPSLLPYTAPDLRTCTACDHKHYCPLAATVGFGKAPTAP